MTGVQTCALPICAEEALELGLIDEMGAPDGVYDAALARARRFLEAPAHVLAGAKGMIDGAGDGARHYVEVFRTFTGS